MANQSSNLIPLVKVYHGISPASTWIKSTKLVIDKLPADMRKLVVISKLDGDAKTRTEVLADGCTVDDIYDCLRANFPDEQPDMQSLIYVKMTMGQNVDDFARMFKNKLSKLGDNKMSVDISNSIFMNAMPAPIRKHLLLNGDQKSLDELISMAKKAEAAETSSSSLMVLEQRMQQVEHEVKRARPTGQWKRNRESTFCTKCEKPNHTADECKAHIVCYSCGKNGHFRRECRKREKLNHTSRSLNSLAASTSNGNGGNSSTNARVDNLNFTGMASSMPLHQAQGPGQYYSYQQPIVNNQPYQQLMLQQQQLPAQPQQPVMQQQAVVQPQQLYLLPQQPQLQMQQQQQQQQQQFIQPQPLGGYQLNPLNQNPNVNGAAAQGVSARDPARPVPLVNAIYSDTLFSIVLQVGTAWLPFMVDSGCTSSVCSTQLAERIKSWEGVESGDDELTTFKLADGKEQKSMSAVVLSFDQLDTTQRFHVLDVAVEAIVGLDFMKATGALLDFGNNIATLKGQTFPLIPYHSETEKIGLTMVSPPMMPNSPNEPEMIGDGLPVLYPVEEGTSSTPDWCTTSIGDQLDSKMKQEVEGLLNEFSDIFHNQLPRNHECNLPAFRIILNDSRPVRTRPYRYSLPQLAEARKQINELITARAIEPSISPYSSPIVLVSKKDHSVRMCIDYRKVNAVTVPDSAWIPRLESYLFQLSNSTIFTTLDMTSGYHQLKVDPRSRAITAFSVDGSGESFQWRKLPFGLRNAPIHFMRCMSQILRLPHVLVYIDDIIIHSNNEREHLMHVRQILEILKKKRIILKPKKCMFFCREVTFLGHSISGEGIRPLLDKLLHVTSPATRTEAKSLIGLLSFYRRFVDRFAANTQNIHLAIKTNPFKWSSVMIYFID